MGNEKMALAAGWYRQGVHDKEVALEPGGIVKPAGRGDPKRDVARLGTLGDGRRRIVSSHAQAALEGATH